MNTSSDHVENAASAIDLSSSPAFTKESRQINATLATAHALLTIAAELSEIRTYLESRREYHT